jgi:hypothetical protein
MRAEFLGWSDRIMLDYFVKRFVVSRAAFRQLISGSGFVFTIHKGILIR